MACDIFELHVLCGVQEEISKGDMRDIIRDSGVEDDQLQKRAAAMVLGGLSGEDAVDALLDDYMAHLRSRSRLMGGRYPLEVVGGNLRAKPGHPQADCYGLLVHCSRLDAVSSKKLAERAAMAFEDVSAQVARIGLGDAFKVYGLGTSAYGASHIFSSNKSKSLRRLARWFHESIDEKFLKAAAGSSGDHGVDIVGKFRMDRLAEGSPAFLGQCAASSDERYWKDKKYDTDKVMEVINFFQLPVKALFVPSYYRNVDGSWFDITNLKNVVVFDRLRLGAIAHPSFVFNHDALLNDLKESFAALAA
jgi:hypothetical protein